MTTTILGAQQWRTNGHLIDAVFRLHVDNPRAPWNREGRKPVIMDVTYGRGVWWSVRGTDGLIMHDRDTLDGVDFRALPEADDSVDVVAYDPPYVSVGGRETTTIPDHHSRFGLTHAPTTPAGLQKYLINPGLDEVRRVLRKGRGRKGLALVKCADYVSSGKLYLGVHHTTAHALATGWTVVDKLIMVGFARAQPRDFQCPECINGNVQVTSPSPTTAGPRGGAGGMTITFTTVDVPCSRCKGTGSLARREVHARQNASTLLVLTPSDPPRATFP